jgi:hypothetical protein
VREGIAKPSRRIKPLSGTPAQPSNARGESGRARR